MRRGTIVLFLFIMAAAALIAFTFLRQNEPPVEIQMAVDPLAEAWVRQMAADFNNSGIVLAAGQRVRVNVTVVSDLEVWVDRPWNAQQHPQGWIPASGTSVRYARSGGLSTEIVVESLAATPLMLGSFNDYVSILADNADNPRLTWADVAEAAEVGNWGTLRGGSPDRDFVRLAFALPNRSSAGLAVLLSAAAAYHQTADLSSEMLRDPAFRDWLRPVIESVPNFNDVGGDAAAFTARRGVINIAVAPESQWLNNLTALEAVGPVRLSYPEYPFVFDFPLARWSGSQMTAVETEAVGRFGAWLSADTQQRRLSEFGLRPADGSPPEGGRFTQAEQRGIDLLPNDLPPVDPPASSAEVQALIRWFLGIR
jgi:hypothetical protein